MVICSAEQETVTLNLEANQRHLSKFFENDFQYILCSDKNGVAITNNKHKFCNNKEYICR